MDPYRLASWRKLVSALRSGDKHCNLVNLQIYESTKNEETTKKCRSAQLCQEFTTRECRGLIMLSPGRHCPFGNEFRSRKGLGYPRCPVSAIRPVSGLKPKPDPGPARSRTQVGPRVGLRIFADPQPGPKPGLGSIPSPPEFWRMKVSALGFSDHTLMTSQFGNPVMRGSKLGCHESMPYGTESRWGGRQDGECIPVQMIPTQTYTDLHTELSGAHGSTGTWTV
ncbi:hypothetical protein B0H17DRAFT_1180093 [Mycena rosella]|uniref:Uncharacterized protein n=1 Tax=Mycena rosella TaxID=1033263 RepID=A0AAD7GIQ2_MYCRO|nr:hypothetical protein B0H17DRAFT_1180093 [Mycena rosella]